MRGSGIMAGNLVRNINRVRDMYDGFNPGEMTKKHLKKLRKAHRDKTLQENPDVLFRIYQDEKLHVLLLKPSNDEEWMKAIQNRISPTQSFQLTKRCAVKGDLPIINMCGAIDTLEIICEEFDQLYNVVMENIQLGEAAASSREAEIDELKIRIRELEVEMYILRRRLVRVQYRRGYSPIK